MQNITLQPEKLYTSEEVSEYLHLSLRTIQRLLQAGSLKSYKIHGQYRIKGLDLLAYLDGVRRDPERPDAASRPVDMLELIKIHPVAIEVASDLVALLDAESNPAFMPALQDVRRTISLELGFVMPGVRLSDKSVLAAGQYRICIQGHPVQQGQLSHAEPAVAQKQLLSELDALVRRHADEILSREEVSVMLEQLRQEHSVVVEEVLSLDGPQPGKVTIGQLTKLLRSLLMEGVSIRNLPLILETLADALEQPERSAPLTELVRQGLARQLCAPLADAQQVIPVLTLASESEAALLKAFQLQDAGLNALSQTLQKQLIQSGPRARALICAVELRPQLFQLLRRHFQLPVISYKEIDRYYRLEQVDCLTL